MLGATIASQQELTMGAAYSQDLRDRVIRAYERGMPMVQIALVFDVSPAWARRVMQRPREGGESTPREMGSPGLRERLGAQSAESAICTVLNKLGLSSKERRSMRPSGIGRMSPSVARAGSSTSLSSAPTG